MQTCSYLAIQTDQHLRCEIITLFNSGTEFQLTFESDDIFRVCLVVLEDNEDFGIVDVVGDRIVPKPGSRTPRRFYHISTAIHKLTGQHSTLEHVLDSVRVCRRVCFLSRVPEILCEVDALSVHCRCTH